MKITEIIRRPCSPNAAALELRAALGAIDVPALEAAVVTTERAARAIRKGHGRRDRTNEGCALTASARGDP